MLLDKLSHHRVLGIDLKGMGYCPNTSNLKIASTRTGRHDNISDPQSETWLSGRLNVTTKTQTLQTCTTK